VKITIDYDDDAERKRLEPLNPGKFPLTYEHLADFVICGTRTPGAVVEHRHGDPAVLVGHAAALTEHLRTGITEQIVKSSRLQRTHVPLSETEHAWVDD
jgi:hypothetical protein